MARVVEVRMVHYDDQPGIVAFLPRGLKDALFDRVLLDSANDLVADENDEETEFRIHGNIGDVQLAITYHLFEQPDDFMAFCRAHHASIDLALLDVAFGSEPVGVHLFRQIHDGIDSLREKVFFLTAYPDLVREIIPLAGPGERLFVKPNNHDHLKDAVLEVVLRKAGLLTAA